MEKGAEPTPGPAGASFPTATLKEELLCPICYDPFRDAVTLCCGHNFCKGCISRSWEQRRHACPLCKQPSSSSSSSSELRVNHTLNNLVGMILQEEGRRKGQRNALCPLHREEATLFCMDDKELACFSCQGSRQHDGHKMRPVQEAAADLRVRDEPGKAGMGILWEPGDIVPEMWQFSVGIWGETGRERAR
ncbi:tripartite motif-containing protein 35-like protein [Willisornis vidua]|uniref:Tripartite motif-containing protein 35-like protein n=1 Tax=Willisornis vidua TaxID=1566151 RepID=A0ABQ9E0G3_9PASS|nr:tripartite motif-containing protein 35-like protein [Willisornis vidua]